MRSYSALIAIVGLCLGSAALAADTATTTATTGKGSYLGFGLQYQMVQYSNASGTGMLGDFQYGRYLDGAVSLGLHAGYGYMKSPGIRILSGGAFVQFHPAGWLFFGRFYADYIMYEDTSGSSRNDPYNGGKGSGFAAGVGVGIQWPQGERFRLAPELSARAGRIKKDPMIYGFAVNLVGDL